MAVAVAIAISRVNGGGPKVADFNEWGSAALPTGCTGVSALLQVVVSAASVLEGANVLLEHEL